jgi:hypothetical protein
MALRLAVTPPTNRHTAVRRCQCGIADGGPHISGEDEVIEILREIQAPITVQNWNQTACLTACGSKKSALQGAKF